MDLSGVSEQFQPPSAVRGMKDMNYQLFQKTVDVPALIINPKSCSILLKNLRRHILKCTQMKSVIPCALDTKKKLLLLNPNVSFNSFSEEEKQVINSNSAALTSHSLELTYDNYSKEDVLRSILPDSVGDITTSFETVGHIAHMNLRDKELEFRNVIGQVILDKTPCIRTVVNKTNTIDSTFRHFKMELLAGDNDMYATVHEHGCTFRFDFSKVFWNSRLHLEHKRISDLIKPCDTVYDVFAGVGPFAIPVGKKGCKVYANDLNPHSYEALNQNRKLNKVEKNVSAFNLDGGDFINMLIEQESKFIIESRDDISQEKSADNDSKKTASVHVLMNLPATAVDFLSAFSQCPKPVQQDSTTASSLSGRCRTQCKEFIIHCYCFSKSDQPLVDARNRIEEQLHGSLNNCASDFRIVRDVAPKKLMVCASFHLPWDISRCKAFQELTEGATNKTQGVKRSHDQTED